MLTKTITVTQEAYTALRKQRRNGETISQTILRLTKNVKPPKNLGKRILETEKDQVPHTFGEGWFTTSDLT